MKNKKKNKADKKANKEQKDKPTLYKCFFCMRMVEWPCMAEFMDDCPYNEV